MDGKLYHQVFYLGAHAKCTSVYTAPDQDGNHPGQVLGRTWNYYIDENLVPALLQ